MINSAGSRFREAITEEKPLQIVGVVNAYVALMAQRAGYQALYVSGAGVSSVSYGLPDLGLTTLEEVVEDVARILRIVDVPLLVDVDTGFDITETIKTLEMLGVGAIHIEDQIPEKRCGHRPGKALVSKDEMVERIAEATEARSDPDFVIVARTDAFGIEGFEEAIARAVAYRDAGADIIFPEAVTELKHYTAFKEAVDVPVLANITEFGQTPLFTTEELSAAGVDIALYPLSATRAMHRAAENVFEEIRSKGSQKGCVEAMQTREEAYEILSYYEYEDKMTNLR